MQGIENEDLDKERCREKDTDITSNPLMQWVGPGGHGFEFTQAGVRTVQIFRNRSASLKPPTSWRAIHHAQAASPSTFLLLPPISVIFHQVL